MSPPTRAAVRAVLKALMAGQIAGVGMLVATRDYSSSNLLIAASLFVLAFAHSFSTYLDEPLPPSAQEPPARRNP